MFSMLTREKRQIEEDFYVIIAEEMEQGIINKGLWTKAVKESMGDQKKTKALYIKFRVLKLKDELNIKQEEQYKEECAIYETENQQKKVSRTVETLKTTVAKTVSIFRLLTLVMFGIGLIGLSLFLNYGELSEGDIAIKIISTILIPLSIYLFYLTYKIKKLNDYYLVRKKLNIFFIILIPFSAIGMIFGVVFPLIAVIMFFTCIRLIISAFKFNNAFRYAEKNSLL